MSSKVKFFTSTLCPYCKPTEYLIKKEKLNIETKIIDLMKNESQSDEYKKINPFGTVPALDDDGFIVYESNTLIKYLCNTNKLEDWYSSDPKKRALVDLYVDFHLQRIWDLVRIVYQQLGYTNNSYEEAEKITLEGLKDLEEKFLSRRKFLASDDRITIADLAFLWHFAGVKSCGIQLSERLNKYWDDVISYDKEGLTNSINSYLEERKEILSVMSKKN